MTERYVGTGVIVDGTEIMFDYGTNTGYNAAHPSFTWMPLRVGANISEPSLESCRTMAEREVADRQEAAEARRAKQGQRGQTPGVNAPVSVYRGTTLLGEYLLRGWHGKSKTPLLTDPETGKPPKLTPGDLGGVTVLANLTPEDKVVATQLAQKLAEATRVTNAWQRPKPFSATLLAAPPRLVVATLQQFSSAERKTVAEVPYAFTDGRLVATMPDGTTVEADDVWDLELRVTAAVHPANGTPCVVVTGDDRTVVDAVYGPKVARKRVYLDLTVEQYRREDDARRAAQAAWSSFVEAHLVRSES